MHVEGVQGKRCSATKRNSTVAAQREMTVERVSMTGQWWADKEDITHGIQTSQAGGRMLCCRAVLLTSSITGQSGPLRPRPDWNDSTLVVYRMGGSGQVWTSSSQLQWWSARTCYMKARDERLTWQEQCGKKKKKNECRNWRCVGGDLSMLETIETCWVWVWMLGVCEVLVVAYRSDVALVILNPFRSSGFAVLSTGDLIIACPLIVCQPRWTSS